RFLDDILSQVKVFDAKNACEGGHHLSCLLPEKMLHHLGDFSRWWSILRDCVAGGGRGFVLKFDHSIKPQLPPVVPSPVGTLDTLRRWAGLPRSSRIPAPGSLWRFPPLHRGRPPGAGSSRQSLLWTRQKGHRQRCVRFFRRQSCPCAPKAGLP